MATVIASAAPACDQESNVPPRGYLGCRFASGRRRRQEIDELLDVGALATQRHRAAANGAKEWKGREGEKL